MIPKLNPRRGEIWMVNFESQTGHEIQKERPAVVLTLPVEQIFQLRLVVPFTGWQPFVAGRITKPEQFSWGRTSVLTQVLSSEERENCIQRWLKITVQ